MKLGFFTAIVPDLSLEQILAFAAQTHFEGLEVACWPPGRAERRFAGITHIDVTRLTQTRADDLNALRSRYGVDFSALGYYPNPLDPNPSVAGKAVAHIKKVILAAELLGLQTINTFAGRDWTRTVDDNWPAFLRTWKPLIAFAEDHGIRVAIENCPMFFGRDEWPGGKNIATTPAIWERMFSDIPSKNFGLNYDPSHFVFLHMDPIAPLRKFKSRIFHLHAKDALIDTDQLNRLGILGYPNDWHAPRLPGFGAIDWPRFISKLYEIQYGGFACIEVEDDTFGKTLAGRKRALLVARNVLAPFFPAECKGNATTPAPARHHRKKR